MLRRGFAALHFALALSLCACRSSDATTWSFRFTRACVEHLESAAVLDQAPGSWPESSRVTGGPKELPFLVAIVFLPLIVDLVILPVTAIHDLCWS